MTDEYKRKVVQAKSIDELLNSCQFDPKSAMANTNVPSYKVTKVGKLLLHLLGRMWLG